MNLSVHRGVLSRRRCPAAQCCVVVVPPLPVVVVSPVPSVVDTTPSRAASSEPLSAAVGPALPGPRVTENIIQYAST